MTKLSIREFKLSGQGGDGLHPWLDARGAFVGDGVASPESVKDLAPGTAIATFTDGIYANAASDNHAAIFLVHRPDRAPAPAAGRSGDILRNCQM